MASERAEWTPRPLKLKVFAQMGVLGSTCADRFLVPCGGTIFLSFHHAPYVFEANHMMSAAFGVVWLIWERMRFWGDDLRFPAQSC